MATTQSETPEAASPESRAFRFLVTPGEGADQRERRWDQAVNDLAEEGKVLVGTGPDTDWPISYQVKDPAHPEGAFYEVYHVVPLAELHHYRSDVL